jgi:hypothetical protein
MESKSVIILMVVILLSSCKSKVIETTKIDSVVNKIEQVQVLTDSSKIETTEEVIYEFDTVGTPLVSPSQVIRGDYKLKLKSIKVKRHIKQDNRLQSLKIDKKENTTLKVDKKAVTKETAPCINEILLILAGILAIYFILKKL